MPSTGKTPDFPGPEVRSPTHDQKADRKFVLRSDSRPYPATELRHPRKLDLPLRDAHTHPR